MSKYEFTLPKYKAVNTASIVNEGITVIAGENGSGKSTLSRVIYYLVNTMSGFPDFVFREALTNVTDIMRSLRDALFQTTNQMSDRSRIRARFDMVSRSKDFEELLMNVRFILDEYEPILDNFFYTVKDSKKQERILDHLQVDTVVPVNDMAGECMEMVYSRVLYYINQAQESIDKHPKALLFDYLKSYGLDLDDLPSKGLKFAEDDVDLLISKFFRAPLSLKRAIYIDTPMAVNDNYNMSTRYWNNLMSLMNQESIEGTRQERFLGMKIRNIINGDILLEKEKYSSGTKLCYKRNDGLEIDLVNAATGFKSFAYILRLLDNGYLKSDTLLLIDEPEAHLHPQWIVEFANILIQLNKKLGVKVIITSHNPDMVSAIRTISEAEDVLDSTRFYLAQRASDYSYDYQDLGSEIAPIFESFNIALDRIELYGARRKSIL